MNEFYEKMDSETKNVADMLVNIMLDVQHGLNLQKHLKDLEDAIRVLDQKIESAKDSGTKYSGLESLKNEFHRLRYEILEKIR